MFILLFSLFFYYLLEPKFIFIFLLSIVFNYSLGLFLGKDKKSFLLLTAGLSVNILLLCSYKYNLIDALIPYGISFFTFQQISYLIDCYRGEKNEKNIVNYALFVSFFPYIISGPIVRFKELRHLMFDEKKNLYDKIFLGISLFLIGIFKKIMIADQLSIFIDPIFSAAESGVLLTFYESWTGALLYSFQIYFDFSSYTDMAIGIGLMFGVNLPINFYSPYKATNISDFWNRWHMSLSRFLRDYLYIPLGGSRRSQYRTFFNLLITMFIAGVWHGTGLKFAVWGIIHGIYLIIFHWWKKNIAATRVSIPNFISILLTFFSVTLSWILFKASSFESGVAIVKSMFGMNGLYIPLVFKGMLGGADNLYDHIFPNDIIGEPLYSLFWVCFLSSIVFFLPNSMQFIDHYGHGWLNFPILTLKADDNLFLKDWNTVLPAIGVLIFIFSLILFQQVESSPFIYTFF